MTSEKMNILQKEKIENLLTDNAERGRLPLRLAVKVEDHADMNIKKKGAEGDPDYAFSP